MATAHSRLRDRRTPGPAERSAPAGLRASTRACPQGNQARLRAAGTQCEACREAKRPGRAAPDRAQAVPVTAPETAAPEPEAAGSVDVWGFPVDRSMCRCRPRVRHGIAWANEAAATYRGCNTPANADGDEVEACFHRVHPEAVEIASTSSSGVIQEPPPSRDPCDRLINRSYRVHETMHARHADDMARAQGPAFFQAWLALAGNKDRLDKLYTVFPAEVDAFDSQWMDREDWATDEIHSYTWARRFLQAALTALDRICP